MTTKKILAMFIWMVLVLYLPNVIGIEKSFYFYLIVFLIALIGISVIEYLFKKKLIKSKDLHKER